MKLTSAQQELINQLNYVHARICISFSLPCVYVGVKWKADVSYDLYNWIISTDLVHETIAGYVLTNKGIKAAK
jgi:DUF2075 family protein